MLEINKSDEITSKSQVFEPQISHNTWKKDDRFQKASITKLWLKRYK